MASINVTGKSTADVNKIIKMVHKLFGNGHLKSRGKKVFVVFKQGRT